MSSVWIYINFILFGLEAAFFIRSPYSIWNFLRFCYALILGVGINFVVLMDEFVGYKFRLYDLDVIQRYYLLGYGCMWIGFAATYFFIRSIREIGSFNPSTSGQKFLQSQRVTKHGLRWLMALSVFASLAYLAKTGLSFGQGSYQSRYNDAEGSGIFLLFIPAFLPWAAYILNRAEKKIEFYIISLMVLAYAAGTFVLLHGYRQLLIASILLTIVLGVRKGILNRGVILIAIARYPIIVIGLTFIRYASEQSTPFADQFTASLYYIQGDLFPIDAPLRTYWFCHDGGNICPGFQVFSDHLTKFLPRVFFPDKPLIAMDAAGFYTQQIVGYGRQLTLSSTILSEALMMQSIVKFSAIFVASGVICAGLQAFLRYSSGRTILFYVVLSNLYMGFFWVREGLEDALNRLIIMGVYVVIGFVAGRIHDAVVHNPSHRQAPRIPQ